MSSEWLSCHLVDSTDGLRATEHPTSVFTQRELREMTVHISMMKRRREQEYGKPFIQGPLCTQEIAPVLMQAGVCMVDHLLFSAFADWQ